jgi:crotonobetainyl-CoA:carnitine CoA-transferase CaiB-like acyl-CoA transferase
MADNSRTALGSIRILDLTEDRGLFAGKLLADLGADVIKVENPRGSRARRVPPFKDDVPALEGSLYFINFNTNKRSITLDIDRPAGKDIYKKLIARADVVIEDYDPGVMQSKNLGYPALKKINRGIIMASISGFGQDGPYSQYKAPDIVSFAMGGLMYSSGAANAPPVVAPGEQAFHGASILALSGILAALFLRLRTGEGQLVDISAHEVLASQNHEQIMRYSTKSDIGGRTGSQHSAAPARIFPCKDGYVHLSVLRTNQWRSFLELVGKPETLTDSMWDDAFLRRRNNDLIDPYATEYAAGRNKAEIAEVCQARGIPCTAVNTPEDFSRDPHVKAREFITEVEHPVIGRHSYLGSAYRLSKTPCRVSRPAPLLGQHNQEIYGSELGFSDEELARLKTEGII